MFDKSEEEPREPRVPEGPLPFLPQHPTFTATLAWEHPDWALVTETWVAQVPLSLSSFYGLSSAKRSVSSRLSLNDPHHLRTPTETMLPTGSTVSSKGVVSGASSP